MCDVKSRLLVVAYVRYNLQLVASLSVATIYVHWSIVCVSLCAMVSNVLYSNVLSRVQYNRKYSCVHLELPPIRFSLELVTHSQN